MNMTKYKQLYNKMIEQALARGYDEFVYPWNENTNLFRRTQARKTATGEIELRVANLRDGEIVYESHWYKPEDET